MDKSVHIVGRKNHGKTTLVEELIKELTGRGLRIGSVKHTGHRHDIDIPGKDSFRHREAGAAPTGIISPNITAVFFTPPDGQNSYEAMQQYYKDCDVVLVESDLEGTRPKVEVWRKERGTPLLANERGDITAVVTDDSIETKTPIWKRSNVPGIADGILKLIES